MLPVGVGIVGLSASGGWAARAHLPALSAVGDFRLTALAASSAAAAKAAGERYGVSATFCSAAELAHHPDVDLVVVAVRATEHEQAVLAAIDAGKHVYCEWPFTVSTSAADALARAARTKGVRGIVNLQARSAPVIRYVRDLVASGWVGDVLSTTVVASGMAWGEQVDSRTSYVLDRDGGSTMVTIPFGHVIDAVTYCLGDLAEVGALMANRRPRVRDRETGEIVAKSAEDQIAVHATLEDGAVVSVHMRGGRSRATNFHWEINGTEGDLVISGDHGHVQLAPLVLRGARGGDGELTELVVPDEYHLAPVNREVPWGNLANAYAAMLQDLRGGGTFLPDFDHGVRLHRVIDAVCVAAASGERRRL